MMHKVDGALDKYFFIFNLRLFFSYLLAENNFWEINVTMEWFYLFTYLFVLIYYFSDHLQKVNCIHLHWINIHKVLF